MTTLQRMLGIELPIIQAPMAGVQGGAPAIAVSNAGGLGSLPCAMLAADSLLNRVVSAAGAVRYPEVDASAARESAASRVGCAGGAHKGTVIAESRCSRTTCLRYSHPGSCRISGTGMMAASPREVLKGAAWHRDSARLHTDLDLC